MKKPNENMTLFYVTYRNNETNKIFFSPFLKDNHSNLKDPKKYNLKDPLEIINLCYSKKVNLNLLKDFEKSIFFLFEKILDYIDDQSLSNKDNLSNIDIENSEQVINSCFFNKKIDKNVEKKNNHGFIGFLRFCILLEKLDKKEFLRIFQHSKVIKIKIDLDHLKTSRTLQEGIHYQKHEINLLEYLNQFKEITRKHKICPIKMCNYSINYASLIEYANNNSSPVLKTLSYYNIIGEDFLQESFNSNRSYKSHNTCNLNLYGEVFKRFIDLIVTLKSSLRDKIFSYEKSISFVFNAGGNNDIVLKDIEACKNALKAEKKNLKKFILHDSNYFITFFTILLKNENSDLENLLHILGVLDNGLKVENYNKKTIYKISSSYDLDFIKEMVTILT